MASPDMKTNLLGSDSDSDNSEVNEIKSSGGGASSSSRSFKVTGFNAKFIAKYNDVAPETEAKGNIYAKLRSSLKDVELWPETDIKKELSPILNALERLSDSDIKNLGDNEEFKVEIFNLLQQIAKIDPDVMSSFERLLSSPRCG